MRRIASAFWGPPAFGPSTEAANAWKSGLVLVHAGYRGVEVCHEGQEVVVGGPAVDAPRHLADGEVAHMAGGARDADHRALARRHAGEADRQVVRVRGVGIGQEAVARQRSVEERLAVRLLQRLEPGERDQLRTLVDVVVERALVVGPGRPLIGEAQLGGRSRGLRSGRREPRGLDAAARISFVRRAARMAGSGSGRHSVFRYSRSAFLSSFESRVP